MNPETITITHLGAETCVTGSCDLLILESTYGDRNHENRADRLEALAKTLDHALSDSGIVYIPAFAMDRDIVEGRTSQQ